jgi:hypothetical protein
MRNFLRGVSRFAEDSTDMRPLCATYEAPPAAPAQLQAVSSAAAKEACDPLRNIITQGHHIA